LCVATAQCGLKPLIVYVSRSHTHIQTHPAGLLWTSDQPDAETATYTTHNNQKRRTSTQSARFEHAIPAVERLHTYTLDVTPAGIRV